MKEKEESLIVHLEALRSTLIKCFIAIGVILPFTFYISPKALNFLIKIMIGKNNITFNYFSPVEVFVLEIKIAFILALFVACPYILRQIWNFILPALYENEKKFIKSIVFISTSLFLLGILFCVFLILPLIVKFGLSFSTNNIQAVFGISNIVTLALILSLVFGIMFQMPLITYSLIKSGIVDYETLADKKPYVVVGLLIVSALLTPPDVISQIMLTLPSYLLFELGLLFSKKGKSNG